MKSNTGKQDSIPIITDIGLKIKELRKTRTNMSYIEFSKKIGIGQNTYLRIELATGDYRISSLLKVLEYYPDYSIKDLFVEIDENLDNNAN